MRGDRIANGLSKFGLLATKLYLIGLIGGIPIAGYFSVIEFHQLKLNELGDFLAGAFGPLAIFWLVLGFFQQGHELRLQVKELALSVEQQKELVGVTRDTLDHERMMANKREEDRISSLEPRFVFQANGGSMQGGPSGKVKNSIRITNSGNSIFDVKINLDPKPFAGGFPALPYWETGQIADGKIQFLEHGGLVSGTMSIIYRNAENRLCEKTYSLSTSEDTPTNLVAIPIGP